MKLRDLWPWGRKATTTLDIFRELYGSKQSKSGETVGLKEAIRCATVFACARVIATGIAQVPLKLFQEDEATDVKRPARQHPLYRVLHRKPNPWQTSYEFREMLGLHLSLAGRAYCFKVMVGGQVKELSGRKVIVSVTLSARGEVCARGEVVCVQMPETFGQ